MCVRTGTAIRTSTTCSSLFSSPVDVIHALSTGVLHERLGLVVGALVISLAVYTGVRTAVAVVRQVR